MRYRSWIACSCVGLAVTVAMATAASLWSARRLARTDAVLAIWDASLVGWWDRHVPFDLGFGPAIDRPRDDADGYVTVPGDVAITVRAPGLDVLTMSVLDKNDWRGREVTALSVRAGFPWRALRGERWTDGNASAPLLVGAVDAPAPGGRGDEFHDLLGRRLIPLRVLPLGLIGDTAVWALAAWLPLFGVRRLRERRRARRGACRRCGYPLPASKRCPECGAAPGASNRGRAPTDPVLPR